MQNTTGLTYARRFLGITAVLVCCLSALSLLANAQSQGQDAVYPLSGLCCQGSSSFIDASMFASGTHDICWVLYGILSTGYPASGAVIDARGLPGATSTSMTCAMGTTPWNNGTTTVSPPSTILLPAGTITIPATWILPSNTHLIGEGDANPTGGTPGTTLKAVSPLSGSGGPFIQFGSSSLCSSPCTGISVERLTINGLGTSTNGIVNQYAGNASLVDHVSLYQVRGTGLLVESSSASNSGPYSNITFDTGTYSGTTATVCAQILNVNGGTRGIHGLFCHSETNDAPAAVFLDSSNNSIEDVAIKGFFDGILVGANGIAKSNVLLNVIGDTSKEFGVLTPVNAVHISTNYSVTDLSVMGASNSGLSGTSTIQDDVTSTTISDTTVALYALGEQASGGYSRFTTSPHAATWGSGTSIPSGNCASSAGGSLFSNSSGSGYALWVCPANGSSASWKSIM
jgi:hypothetical protein